MNAEILIVDDEDDIRSLIQGILEDEGYATRQAASAEQAYKAVAEKTPSLVILDIWLQGSEDDGLDILRKLRSEHKNLPVVMISGHGTIETAVSALKDGAYDFVEKPFKTDRLLLTISRALENARLKRENAVLKKRTQGPASDLNGSSALIQGVMQTIERVAPTNSRVLLSGEPGTGKDIAARMIHKKSQRANEAFLILNCATLRPERLEIELFGAAEGLNGDGEQVGILEQAHGGTLLLDEIADMPLETQGKIVRVLQEQRFHRVGEQTSIEVDVRVLATTNRNIETLIAEGRFRQDLYYRLNVVPVEMPPLRARVQDTTELAQIFLDNFLKQTGFAPRIFSSAALSILKNYKWPGNIRQLRNVIEWVVIMHGAQGSEDFAPEHLPPEISGARVSAAELAEEKQLSFRDDYLEMPLREAREEFERQYLVSQIQRFDGNISRTAQFVGMERSALHRKLKSLNAHSEKDEMTDADTDEQKRKRA
ncbi:MAG: sigma-54-dependent Fis family transcriptional regulator [Alphaproteobacteria bacterium]|nr:sigma-54-dependent Fis family transcriptional regulator [Alphaproteobacteria bacterium]